MWCYGSERGKKGDEGERERDCPGAQGFIIQLPTHTERKRDGDIWEILGGNLPHGKTDRPRATQSLSRLCPSARPPTILLLLRYNQTRPAEPLSHTHTHIDVLLLLLLLLQWEGERRERACIHLTPFSCPYFSPLLPSPSLRALVCCSSCCKRRKTRVHYRHTEQTATRGRALSTRRQAVDPPPTRGCFNNNNNNPWPFILLYHRICHFDWLIVWIMIVYRRVETGILRKHRLFDFVLFSFSSMSQQVHYYITTSETERENKQQV